MAFALRWLKAPVCEALVETASSPSAHSASVSILEFPPGFPRACFPGFQSRSKTALVGGAFEFDAIRAE